MMSGYKIHLIGGSVATALAFGISTLLHYFNIFNFNWGMNSINSIISIPLPEFIFMIIIGLYSSIVSDIDIGTSIAHKITVFTTVVFIVLLMILNILSTLMGGIILVTFITLVTFTDHRGFTHSWWFLLIFSVVMAFSFKSIPIGLSSLLGGYSHLLLDRELY